MGISILKRKKNHVRKKLYNSIFKNIDDHDMTLKN